jgi:hypothetical protein
LPPSEINSKREELKSKSNYSDTEQILSYDSSVKGIINKWFSDNLLRVCETIFFPCSIDEYKLKSQLNKFKNPYTLHIALFFAMDDVEKQNIILIIEQFRKEFLNVIFIVFNAVLNYDATPYNHFISYVAEQQVAINHNLKEQAEISRQNAIVIINNWITRIKQNPFNLYFRDTNDTATTSNIAKYINDNIGHKIFNSSAESMRFMRTKPLTFWKPQNSKTAAEAMLDAYDRDDAIKKFTGQYTPGKFLFKTDTDDDVVFPDLKLNPNISPKYVI